MSGERALSVGHLFAANKNGLDKRWSPAVDGSPAGSDSNTLGKRCSRNAASFDLNGRVPVIENVLSVLVPNAPRQMIINADTDLSIVKGLR